MRALQLGILAALLLTFYPAAADDDGGLCLSVTASNGLASSSVKMKYSSEKIDSITQSIKVDSNEATLENGFSGTGDLKYASLSVKDTNGNCAGVFRSVDGKAGYTTWRYSWGTHYPCERGQRGVGAWESMNVCNAYSINVGSSASNKEGDYAAAATAISSSNPISCLSDYYTNPRAYASYVTTYQQADSGKGDSATFSGYSKNKEGDYAGGSIKASGTGPYTGAITDPYNREYASKKAVLSYESTSSACGKRAEISSLVKDMALAKEYLGSGSYRVYSGAGEFGIRRFNNEVLKGSVEGTATATDLDISPSIDGLPRYRSATILDPYRYAIVKSGALDLRTTAYNSLLNKEYAVTYYSDSAVSSDRVYGMGDYYFSLINTHASNNVLGISRFSDENYDTGVTASDLEKNFANGGNGITILSGCSSFKPDAAGQRPLYNAIKDKTQMTGGYDYTVYAGTNSRFLSKFVEAMCSGKSARQANTEASAFVDNRQKLTLLPAERDVSLK